MQALQWWAAAQPGPLESTASVVSGGWWAPGVGHGAGEPATDVGILDGPSAGDPAAGPLRHEVGGSLYTGAVAATWREGAVVNITVAITAFHKGRFGLRICRIQGTGGWGGGTRGLAKPWP